ncbi:hypothetical protein EWW49_00330 [Pseudomonas syringae]|uniref:hypothetical protein n=1 Tax=Pseudomonas sp. MWU16-30316 TaxID=2878093 RepID=UPI001103F684|nr:hypothetical protein [Pseudomonas sp. MWU16-30316]TFZ37797.1 hypothetical protein EWW49_00330 [Pseudomonas syringae]
MELPPLPTLTNEQQEDRVIVHDLAQRLMAMELGFGTGQISVGMSFGLPSSLSKNRSKASGKLNSATDVAAHLRKRIMVLSAGVIGEVHWFHKLLGFDMENGHVESIYQNGVIDGATLTDKDKIQELLIILCGIEREPSGNYQLLEEQKLEIFGEIYQQSTRIFDSFSEKLFILANLTISERWSNRGLSVSGERLAELETKAETLLIKSLSTCE